MGTGAELDKAMEEVQRDYAAVCLMNIYTMNSILRGKYI
jgi:hypothetical protein